MPHTLRSTSELDAYAGIDGSTPVCDAIGSLHLHGSTSPRAQYRGLFASSRSNVPSMSLNCSTTKNYNLANIAKWGFVALQPSLGQDEERYPDKYADLFVGSVPDYSVDSQNRGCRSFPKPIGSGRPVLSQHSVTSELHRERTPGQEKPRLSHQPHRDSTGALDTATDASAGVLLNQFQEVINSILDLLGAEDESTCENEHSSLKAPEQREHLDTPTLVCSAKKSKYQQQGVGWATPTGFPTTRTPVLGKCRAGRSIRRQADRDLRDFDKMVFRHGATGDEIIMRYMEEKMNPGPRKSVRQSRSGCNLFHRMTRYV
jgi:hypothetical protein